MPPVTSELPVDGASVTTFDRYGDSRGYFNELYNETKYDESLQKDWKQVSFSSSQKHAMRGLHCSPHGKFITCVRGAFYDVIADFREDSPTFGRWCGVLLSEHNKKQVFVPANCGHGFFTMEDNTCALYLQQGCFNPANEKDNHPLDPLFDVQWPVPLGVVPEMSGKDTAAPTLAGRRPHLTGMAPRGRVLIIGASGQVGGALLEAFGPENCIGTYTNTKIKGMVPFDMCRAVLTRTSRGLGAVRTGYAYQPPACCTYRRHRAAGAPRYVRPYTVRVSASGVPYVPRTVWCTTGRG